METSLREPRPEKVAVVDEVRARLASSNAAILTEYRGLQVKQLQELRRQLTAAGGEYRVFKNTLVRRAASGAGLEGIQPLLVGPTAIAFVDGDVAAVAKVLRDFARANPSLVVKGGLIGDSLIDARETTALADLPSREVLLAQFAGLLAAPMQRFAALLQALPLKFAYGLRALIEDRGGSPLAEEPPVEEALAEEPPAAAIESTTAGAEDESGAPDTGGAPAEDSTAAEATAESPVDDGEPAAAPAADEEEVQLEGGPAEDAPTSEA